MIIFGIKFWAWGSKLTEQIWHCAQCGFQGQFIEKKGMRFFTLYWVIPLIPVSRVTSMVQCPTCKTRYSPNSQPVYSPDSLPAP